MAGVAHSGLYPKGDPGAPLPKFPAKMQLATSSPRIGRFLSARLFANVSYDAAQHLTISATTGLEASPTFACVAAMQREERFKVS
jgi:hypothetical protein